MPAENWRSNDTIFGIAWPPSPLANLMGPSPLEFSHRFLEALERARRARPADYEFITTSTTNLTIPQEDTVGLVDNITDMRPASVDMPDGSVWVWAPDGYRMAVHPLAERLHTHTPISEYASLGDPWAFAAYVRRYSLPTDRRRLITWNADGILADLAGPATPSSPDDAHLTHLEKSSWTAHLKFETTTEWKSWAHLAGRFLTQAQVVEFLDEHSEEIQSPAEPHRLLQTLQATVSSSAETALREDGSTSVVWKENQEIRASKSGEALIPSRLTIQIPVLSGHATNPVGNAERKLVKYSVAVRLKVRVDGTSLKFSLSVRRPDEILQAACADVVAITERALGEGYPILRVA